MGVVILVAIAASVYINFFGIGTHETVKSNYAVEITPARVERGKKLASMLCSNCHANNETGKLTGKRMLDAPAEFGEVFSQNITQDKEFGIGNWTDAEIMYLLRTGIKKDGKYAPPYMAKMGHMADEDIASVIAFLRSDDPSVAASNTKDFPCKPSFLTKFLCTVAFKPLPMPEKPIALPDTNNAVELGKYLVFNLDCYTCHSKDFTTMNVQEPEKSEGYMGGGNKPLNLEGKEMVTQNLSPDKETGIGNWTEEQFVRVLKTGIKEGEDALRYPMMPYMQLTDREAKAIYAYLMTIPPISNKVQRSGL